MTLRLDGPGLTIEQVVTVARSAEPVELTTRRETLGFRVMKVLEPEP